MIEDFLIVMYIYIYISHFFGISGHHFKNYYPQQCQYLGGSALHLAAPVFGAH